MGKSLVSLVSALEVFLNDMRYINPRFTYLLTYLLSCVFLTHCVLLLLLLLLLLPRGVYDLLYCACLQITGRQEQLAADSALSDEWHALGNIIDRLLFVASLVLLSCVTLWMVVKSAESPHGHDEPSFHATGH